MEIVKLPHHEQEKLCENRPAYRQGRKLTAVKVYTINNESRHLIINGVPKLQLRDELKRVFSQYGNIKVIHALNNYPCEAFEEAFHIHYVRIQSARVAKHLNDQKNFYGGLLHVFYAPELETLDETREKLAQRRKDVFVRLERHAKDPINPRLDPFIPVPIEKQHRKKKHPAFEINKPQNTTNDVNQHENENTIEEPSSFVFQPPYQMTDAIFRTAGVQESKIVTTNNVLKRKNYKGRSIDDYSKKSKAFKPQIVDTTKLLPKKEEVEREMKNHFINAKSVDRGITIKMPKVEDKVKRIIMKSEGSTLLVKPSEELQTSIQTAKEQIREAMLNKINTTQKSDVAN